MSNLTHDKDACMIAYRGSCKECQVHWLRWLLVNGAEEDWRQLTVEELLAAYEHACNLKDETAKRVVNGWIQIVDSL